MKKLYFLLVMGAVAWGCGDKDRFMVSGIPTTPILDSKLKILIKDNSLINVRLDSIVGIRGFSDKNYFETADQFVNFSNAGISLPKPKLTPYSYSRSFVVYASGTSAAPVINYSLDYGKTWASVAPKTFAPVISTTGFYSTELVCTAFIDSNNVMLSYQQKSNTEADSRQYYQLNLNTATASRVIWYDDAFQPLNMQFVNNKTGWMLLYKNSAFSTFITKTRDTGRTWSEPVAIDKRVINGLQIGKKGNIAAIEDAGNVYISTDSGATWKKPAADLKLASAYMVNPATVYGVSSTGVMKSTDTGVTWNTVSDNMTEYLNMKKIHFQDEQNGIMYGDQKLYITADGGVNWKVLLYPYPYMLVD
ncbi:hypothetical protein A4H97_19070 [Niastella yeongjuensis]|uniref:Photosynthesis system II assembly factor Ycf48/Hcf136-like domain-containing protein n=1 Tax=Niastella yeongjuensis TaxID=354355 RepID=A0A1V9DY64_9BACT|nr:hypothetical protein [Niastella yeongjuensis]OQP38817.1 hypothetical protein A4H97_19070 [Niastella yeongjuensis]SEO31417.1 hypothetical protein SAMN05660816_02588 [Niastella yeongjuensis]